jgi:hypothetical protein
MAILDQPALLDQMETTETQGLLALLDRTEMMDILDQPAQLDQPERLDQLEALGLLAQLDLLE